MSAGAASSLSFSGRLAPPRRPRAGRATRGDREGTWLPYYRTQLTMPALLDRAALHHSETMISTRVSDGLNYIITYGTHQMRTKKLASALTMLGIQKGDVIGSFMWNNSRHLQIYHGVPCMGCVLHTINIRLHPEKIAYIIQHAEDVALFVDESLLPMIAKVPKEAFRNLKLLVICGKDERPPRNGVKGCVLPELSGDTKILEFEDLMKMGDPSFAWPDLDENDPMALCYTSGTTGMPKGVMYSHRSQYITVMGNLAASQQGFRPIDTALPVVPMFHAMAWGIPYAALTVGCELVLTNEYMSPNDIISMIKDFRVTVLSGVPTIWQGLKRALQADPEKHKKIKGVFTRGTVGGSKFAIDLLRWFWSEWGVEVIQTWGMTETNPLGSATRRMDGQDHLNFFSDEHLKTVGRPVVGNEFKIIDPDTGEALPRDAKSVGELLVRGPAVTTAYYKKIGKTPKSFVNNWLNTGDLASISQHGYVTIHDRAKDVIKSGGEWISSVDLENTIRSMPQVRLACVVGVPHPKWDERPIAVVELEEGKTVLSLTEVRKHCAEHFAKFQLPDDVLIWAKVPVSGTGEY
uniref:AMP-dependent synthetase/ligase domain-containing protein n=1 Tax=Lotharella globosa TaxID=91324 RepID=A0A7S4DT90_9EUKA